MSQPSVMFKKRVGPDSCFFPTPASFRRTKKRKHFFSKKMSSGNERDPLEDPPPSTQVSQPSNRNYIAVFLFRYDIDTEEPFISVPLDHFEGSDFPFDVINGHMGLSDRLKPRNLSRLPESKYCIFAKCEEGIYCLLYFTLFFCSPAFLYCVFVI